MLHLAARKYLGVPFLHQGRNPEVGIDCVGLAELVSRDCGMTVGEAIADYARNPHAGLLEARLREHLGPPHPLETLQPGDLVAMRFRGPIRHVGIIGDHEHGISLIHTSSAVGRVVEHRIDERWLAYIAHVHRWEPLA